MRQMNGETGNKLPGSAAAAESEVNTAVPETVNELEVVLEQETAPVPEEPPKPEYTLTVAVNSMAAYLRVKIAEGGSDATPEEILEFLAGKNIVYGILEQDIRAFCANKRYYLELTCAKGLPPADGIDGSLAFHFECDHKVVPLEREDGTMDFFNLNLIQSVTKGGVLCSLVPAVPGTDGINVYGAPVPHRPGVTPQLPSGENTVASEDGLFLLAAVDGSVEYRSKTVAVSNVYTIKGDVNVSTGNIDFVGSVVVQGDVREGFSVKAGKDVNIRGMAEGAYIEAGENIVIASGMNGRGTGQLTAGGDITGKFFERVNISCEGDVYAEVMMNSNVRVKGSLILKGSKGAVIGGIYEAGSMVYANTIGSDNYIPTHIRLSSPEIDQALVGETGEALSELRSQMAQLDAAVETLEGHQAQLMRAGTVNQDIIRALIKKKNTIVLRRNELQSFIEREENRSNELEHFKVIALSRAFPEVRIAIGPYTQVLETEYSNSKFYAGQEGIVFAPILPSDRL